MKGRKFDLWMPFLYRSAGGLLLVAISMTPLSNKYANNCFRIIASAISVTFQQLV